MINKNKIKWEKTGCSNCGNLNLKVFLKDISNWEFPGYKFNLVKCRRCSLIFINPRPKQEYIGNFYKAESYWGENMLFKKNEMEKNKTKRDINFSPVYNLILKNIKKGRILDIGAGTGIFLTKFKELGWDIEGVEKSGDAVSFAKKVHKINLIEGDFISIGRKFKKDFDIITLNMVLEHLYDPLKTLKACRKVLKNDGRIIVVVPNIESLGFKIFGERWYPLEPPIHLYQFSPRTVCEILENAGFKIITKNQSYFVHNYFSLFESIRFIFSKEAVAHGLKNDKTIKGNKISLSKETGKIFAKTFAYIFSFVGPIFSMGETIVIYAKKN